MKRITLAAFLLAAATTPFAQTTAEAPKHKCEPKPEYPGRLAMQSDTRRGLFERELKNYQTCMNAYLAERKAVMKANEDNANEAIAEYNAVMKKINEDQKAANN
ncbi:MAG: hypothetical protein ACXWG1_01620 [Usitatibacter sp.]